MMPLVTLWKWFTTRWSCLGGKQSRTQSTVNITIASRTMTPTALQTKKRTSVLTGDVTPMFTVLRVVVTKPSSYRTPSSRLRTNAFTRLTFSLL